MIIKYLYLSILLLNITFARAQSNYLVLKGATIIDLSNYGTTENDIHDAIVIIKDGKIEKAGKSNTVSIPTGSKIIDVTGKYIIPGLIDGFSVINNQGQANAHLFMGVTTIGCSADRDERRGPCFTQANPSPQIKQMLAIPDDEWNDLLEAQSTLTAEDIKRINGQIDNLDSLKTAGISTIFLHHRFPPQLLDKLMSNAKSADMSTIGEVDLTPYTQAMTAGVNSFLHTSRYILAAMPDNIRLAYMENPQDSIAFKHFMQYFHTFSIESDQGFINYANQIASSNTALMPTLSMLYSSLPDHKNLWKMEAAKVLDPDDIWLPMDPATGNSTSFLTTKYALRSIEIEKGFAKHGVRYLTGSGTDAFGTMPGISEHIEIMMLHDIGLTKRQAIAAATNNFSIFFGWDDIGEIAEGRKANLLVLPDNPVMNLEALKKIDILMLDGKIINRESLLEK